MCMSPGLHGQVHVDIDTVGVWPYSRRRSREILWKVIDALSMFVNHCVDEAGIITGTALGYCLW